MKLVETAITTLSIEDEFNNVPETLKINSSDFLLKKKSFEQSMKNTKTMIIKIPILQLVFTHLKFLFNNPLFLEIKDEIFIDLINLLFTVKKLTCKS